MLQAFDAMDDSARLIAQVERAFLRREPLRIRGGNSKEWLGRKVDGAEIDMRAHRGIVSYDPTELVITARAGTPIADLNRALDDANQMLPCEPPNFGSQATIGGAVASGLSGPRRPWSGSMRDFVLGCRIISGHARHLRFGGEVMKNVAGYDMSRLLAGSFGCLGILTEVSLKVLPKPRRVACLELKLDVTEALARLSSWRKSGLPVSGACYTDGRLHVRIEGGEGSVRSASDRVGGAKADPDFWAELRDHRLPFFNDPRALWRLSLPNNSPLYPLPGDVLIDWAGSQRWLKSEAPASAIRSIAHAAGGHATCFSRVENVEPFHPLPEALMRFHKQLKMQLDPRGIFNPGRMYANF
jgi:glycolate oxidase FAD binding subunit